MTLLRSALRTALQALLLIPFAVPAQAQTHILYSASASGTEVSLSPIVRVTGAGSSVKWAEVDRTKTVTGLEVGRRYATQLDLAAGPAVTIDSVLHEPFGCDEEATYKANGRLATRIDGDHAGVAGNFPGLTRSGRGPRAPTAAESAVLRDSVTAALGRLGIGAAAIDSVHWYQRVVDTIPGGSAFLATAWFLDTPGRWSGDTAPGGMETGAWGVMILERVHGRWQVTFGESGQGTEVDLRRREVIGVVDLDGDATSEIVIANNYYESWDYQILARRRGKWLQVWRGAGEGC